MRKVYLHLHSIRHSSYNIPLTRTIHRKKSHCNKPMNSIDMSRHSCRQTILLTTQQDSFFFVFRIRVLFFTLVDNQWLSTFILIGQQIRKVLKWIVYQSTWPLYSSLMTRGSIRITYQLSLFRHRHAEVWRRKVPYGDLIKQQNRMRKFVFLLYWECFFC